MTMTTRNKCENCTEDKPTTRITGASGKQYDLCEDCILAENEY